MTLWTGIIRSTAELQVLLEQTEKVIQGEKGRKARGKGVGGEGRANHLWTKVERGKRLKKTKSISHGLPSRQSLF